jgi:hypothetical protein
MSLLFSHFDERAHDCDHAWSLGPSINGVRVCSRCGKNVPEQSVSQARKTDHETATQRVSHHR